MDKLDVRRMARDLPEVTEDDERFEFRRAGRLFVSPYLERVEPKKPRIARYDRFVVRVASADDKEALLLTDPDIFFTTDHYTGWATVIVRLDAIGQDRLAEVIRDAWTAAPSSSKLKRAV